jgi:hypothetical protein
VISRVFGSDHRISQQSDSRQPNQCLLTKSAGIVFPLPKYGPPGAIANNFLANFNTPTKSNQVDVRWINPSLPSTSSLRATLDYRPGIERHSRARSGLNSGLELHNLADRHQWRARISESGLASTAIEDSEGAALSRRHIKSGNAINLNARIRERRVMASLRIFNTVTRAIPERVCRDR